MKKFWLTTKGNSVDASRKRAVGSVFFLAILMVGLFWFLPRVLTGVAGVVFSPIEQVRVWLSESSSTLPVLLRDRKTLLEEIRQLEIKIATEQGTESTIRRLQIENQEFRELLGAVGSERLLARVVARPPQLPYDVILLDRGSDHGVVLDSPVFSGHDTVVGIVSQVSAKTSLVTLVSHPAVTFTVFVTGSNIFTLAEGMGNGVVRVRVPQGIMLHTSDIVLLPGVEAAVVGLIEEVITTPTKPERHGYIRYEQSMQSLQYVSVGREPVTTPDFDQVETTVTERVTELLSVPVPLDRLVLPEAEIVPEEGAESEGSEGEEVQVEEVESSEEVELGAEATE